MKLLKKSQYGNFPEEVLNPSAVMKIIEDTDPLEIFREHVSEMYGGGNTFGITYTVEVDMRDGSVGFCENRPGTSGMDDCFKIVLGTIHRIMDFETDDLISPDDEQRIYPTPTEKKALKEKFGLDDDDFDEDDDGISLNFWDVDISADEWIEFWEKYREDWDSYQKRCEDAVLFHLHEMEFEKPSLRNIEAEYYNDCKCEDCGERFYQCECEE